MRRLVVCIAIAVLFALVGPRLVGPQNRDAKAAFSYEPPEGFTVVTEGVVDPGVKAWVVDENVKEAPTTMMAAVNKRVATVRVVATQSSKEMSVEEVDLAKLVDEMPKVFEECSWVHRRHELRTRGDGGRVGLIEGDCNKEVDLTSLGMQAKTLKSRKLQLMFPNDNGTAIVTASYPTDQAAKWEPIFEATINKAKGVAIRVPSPPVWTIAAWAAAGAVLGFLASAIFARRASAATSAAPAAAAATARRKESDDDA